jgi:hypothetical protein
MICTLDYPHAPIWCPACDDRQQQAMFLAEMRRTNDLKASEIELRSLGEWVNTAQSPRRVYVQTTPKATQTPKTTGGTSIEPRRIDG